MSEKPFLTKKASELLRAWDLMQIETPQSIEKGKQLKGPRNSAGRAERLNVHICKA
jgi:hypothetical protein